MRTLRFELADLTATERAGAAIAPYLRGGMVVTLSGELGAGKTTLVRGVLRGLRWRGPVKSPTFTLVEHYALSSLYLYHFDFYRVADPVEWETTGFAECFTEAAASLIEWPERVADRLPPADLAMTLTMRGPGRALEATARTEEGERCVNALSAALPPIG